MDPIKAFFKFSQRFCFLWLSWWKSDTWSRFCCLKTRSHRSCKQMQDINSWNPLSISSHPLWRLHASNWSINSHTKILPSSSWATYSFSTLFCATLHFMMGLGLLCASKSSECPLTYCSVNFVCSAINSSCSFSSSFRAATILSYSSSFLFLSCTSLSRVAICSCLSRNDESSTAKSDAESDKLF